MMPQLWHCPLASWGLICWLFPLSALFTPVHDREDDISNFLAQLSMRLLWKWSPVCPVAFMCQIHSPTNLVVKHGSPLPSPSWRQGASSPDHSVTTCKYKSAPILVGQYEKLKRPWFGASTASEQLKQCIILILKPKLFQPLGRKPTLSHPKPGHCRFKPF